MGAADRLASAEMAVACPSDCVPTSYGGVERALYSFIVTASSLLSLDTAGLASLVADGDVPTVNEDTGVVDRVGKVALLDEGLESTLQELGRRQSEHIIELALVVLQETESHHSADEGLTFKESSGILLVHREQNTSSFSKLGERELRSPDLTLAAKTVSSDQFQLVDKLLSLERSSRILGCLTVVRVLNGHLEGLIFG